jgi:hypothetical protein
MREFVIGILEKRWGQYFDTINNLEKSNGHHYFGKLNPDYENNKADPCSNTDYQQPYPDKEVDLFIELIHGN